MTIRRGRIYIAVLDPTVGNEISKTRPVLVVSNDQNNEFSGTVTVLSLTSKNIDKIYPFEVLLPKGTGKPPKTSKVKADQVRTLDKSRLVKLIGPISGPRMAEVEEALKVHLGL